MKRCWITPGLVRVDHPGLRVGSVRQRFSKQRFGRIGRTKSRQEKVDRGSRRIEGSIEVEPAAFNPQDRKLGARKQRLCRRVPFRLGTLRLPRSRTMASSGYSWRGAESVPRVALCRITGYRRSHWGDQRRPIIRSIRTLRIRQGHGLDGSTAISTSPLRAASILTRNHFHELSRANGPKGQGRKTKQQDSAVLKSKSLWNPVSPAH
jgi:hypothetical protein